MIKYFKNFYLRKIIKNFNKGLFQDTKSSNEGIILCEFLVTRQIRLLFLFN